MGSMSAVDDDHYADERETPGAARAPRVRYNPPKDRDPEAFRRASRHSGLVKRLRIILPVIAALGVVVFWASAKVIPGDMQSLVSVASIDPTSNSVVMDKPHISGFEGTRRAYEVKAESALQSLDDPKVVTFKTISGRFGLEDAGTATVNAASGTYDGNKNTLVLKEGIELSTTDGTTGRLTDAAIDLGTGSLTSSAPLQLSTPQGTIKANAVNVMENGKRIIFSNGVSVTYLPPGDLVPKPANSGEAAQ
jgi:lipopolysaccharide export system protein LptC